MFGLLRPRVRGQLDAVRYRTVIGWAYDSRYPDRPPTVRIQINGQDGGLAVADRPRPDLGAAGVASRHRGFEWYVPDSCNRIESVRVRTVDGDVELPSTEAAICQDTNRPLPQEWRNNGCHRLPSFFILGAAKCGTTSLHAYLGEHPDICVSHPKEPFFFEAEFDRGSTFYFNRYFSHWKGEPIVGEARHRNLYMPYTAERIFRFNPNAKLIVCLRNPAERAVSHWASWYFCSKERLSLRKSLERDWERIQAGVSYDEPGNQQVYARTLDPEGKGILRTYIDSGYYLEQIERFLALFPREQLHIVLLEDFARAPRKAMAEILRFLGANTTLAADCSYAVFNPSSPDMLNHAEADTLAWLVRHYRPHNERLAKFLGRDLAHWDLPFQSGMAES